MQLETKRLLLRPWREADAESLYEYARDPDVGPMAGWPPHKCVEDSREVIGRALNGPECYAVCRKEDGAAIGSIELKLHGDAALTEREDECELGYWIGKPFWGQGLIPEAAGALLRRGFEELGMSAVWCGYYEGNVKSKRVQEKLGFVHMRTWEDAPVPPLGETRTEQVSRLIRERWLAGEAGD